MGMKSKLKTEAKVLLGTALLDGVSGRQRCWEVLRGDAKAKFGYLDASIAVASSREELGEILWSLHAEYNRSPGADCAQITRELYEFNTVNSLS